MSTPIAIESSTLQRYATWEAKLRENIVLLARQRTTFYRIFFGVLFTSTLGFFLGAWFGVASFLTGVAFCGTGLYLTMMRAYEYEEELARTRAELRRLTESRSDEGSARDGAP
jgi:hypothetical protein